MNDMAKKKEMTPEEKLTEALVPVEEQPYEVPDNWCWTTVKSIFDLINGRAFKPKEWTQDGLPIVRIQNLNNEDAPYNYYNGAIDEAHLLNGGELLFAWSGTPGTSFGAHIWRDEKAVLNQHIYKLNFNESYNNKIYLKYALNQRLDELIAVAHGGAGLQHITKGVFEKTPITLPPLQEQNRIVNRIESLFANLDEAKEKIQHVLDGAELRKSAILHKAFTGELTRKWRQENGIADDSWEEKQLKEICRSIFDGDHMPPPKTDIGVPFLVISNVNRGVLSFENTRFVGEDYYNGLSSTRKPAKGDVLYTLVGSYGIPVVVDTDRAFCFQRHMGLLKLNEKVTTYFLWYILQTKEFFDKATGIAKGTAQLTVPIKGLRDLSVIIPPVSEQQEIVRLLDDFLAKEKSAMAAAEQALTSIDLMKKSILARAFRGQLGTNDPTEESSVELLKEILA